MAGSSDPALVRRAAAGDPDAFGALVARHRQALAALIRLRIGNPDEADDVLQDTLLAAWLQIGSVRDPSRFKAWLLQIARNQCRDYYRSKYRRETPTEKEALAQALSRFGRGTASERERVEDVLDLRQALDSLAPDHREVVDAFYVLGLTISEIAGRARRPEGTVKRWFSTARHHLRERMEVSSSLVVEPRKPDGCVFSRRADQPDSSVVGVWVVTVGERAFRCLRVIDVGPVSEEEVLIEAFVDERGRTVLARRYNGRLWAQSRYKTPWDERLPDALRIVIDGVTFVHWYDCLTDVAFSAQIDTVK